MQDEAGHLIGEYDGSGNLIEETVYLGDIPVATLQPNGSGGINVYYISTDHLNAPRKIQQPTTDTLAWRWDTDPFGTAAPNQNPGGLGTFVYNERFPGQYYMAETGLNQNVNRDYDPLAGGYVESDPIGLFGGSYSPYVYANGDPIIYVDQYGLCWVYSQSTGRLSYVDADGNSTYVGSGYSGYGPGLNNPAMQNVQNIGPLPQGDYTIGPQQDNGSLRQSMRLTPNPSNQMFNRWGFLIHGPHDHDNHDSSNGCPVLNKSIRDKIASSGDSCFKVVQ
jgi:RHS repeat-associated protein